MTFWLVRFLVPGLAVVAATLVAQRFNPIAGGMLLAFPFVIGSGLLFTMSQGEERFVTTTWSALLGLVPLGCSLIATALVARSAPIPLALLTCVATWLAVALPLFLVTQR